ncbi:MAG: sulfate/molybdate ABC transporter ATP-binding protein [Clostridiales Family XIII bacterium]|jgi:molybdate transport system ATP-binding protein|nr:sulfate/molybdate ABC transporter ATP-binding protein [Clostridiales Family XIII bacterium]
MGLYVDIKKSYKGFTLTSSFESGKDSLGILGASGSGKSVTLKCIAGLITPDEGVIKVNGKTVFDSAAKINLPPQQRNVGYLFQNYALFPHMTVWANIALAIRDKSKNKEKTISDLLERYELTGLEKRYPTSLSGGQQQRVALARIFAYEPEILLLDEPFSALDAFLRENMQAQLIRILKDYDGDVVLVTHSRDEVYRICSRLLIMSKGNIVANGETNTLFQNPPNVISARITGCKNLSEIERLSEYRVRALDWGCEIETDEPIDEAHTNIGIRAHYFTKTPAGAAADYSRIPVEVDEVMDSAFDKTVILRVPGVPHRSILSSDKTGEDGRIWWICEKNTDISGLDALYVHKKDLLLLRS